MRIHPAALFFLSFYVVIAQAGYQYCSSFLYCKCGYYNKIYKYCNSYHSRPEEFCKRFYQCSSYTGYINSHDQRSEGAESYFYEYDCQDPGFISNAIRQTTGGSRLSTVRTFKKGETVIYACESKEFEIQGTPYLTCTSGGVWSSPLPKCTRLSNCQDPGFIPNAVRKIIDGSRLSTARTFKQGETVIYVCESKEFVRHGTPYLTCTSEGVWSSPLPRCIKPSICQDPGFISNAIRQTIDGSRISIARTFKEGETVIYICESKEFALQGSPYLTCTKDGVWTGPLPRCVKPSRTTYILNYHSKPKLSLTTHYWFDKNIYHGIQVDYEDPEQTLASCPDPGIFPNGGRSVPRRTLLRTDFLEETRLVYFCYKGYFLRGEEEIVCLNTGKWSAETPTCEPDNSTFCNNPEPILNGEITPKSIRDGELQQIEYDGQYPVGTRLEYSCHSNNTLEGSSFLMCGEGGTWSTEPPICIPNTANSTFCSNPKPILNGEITPKRIINGGLQEIEYDSQYPAGTRLEYSCHSDHTLEGSSFLICEEIGSWSAEPPVCILNIAYSTSCKNPEPILNGKITPKRIIDGEMQKIEYDIQYPVGTRLEYSCHSNYSLEGSPVLICEEAGTWSAESPNCFPNEPERSLAFCPDPGMNPNGERTPVTPLSTRGFTPGDRLEYFCSEGYSLKGEAEVYCLNTSNWSSEVPTCEPDPGGSLTFCPDPGIDSNGERIPVSPTSPSGFVPGDFLEYFCSEGYILSGEEELYCFNTGNWSSDAPTCEPETSSVSPCKDPGPLMNGIITPISVANGEELQEIEPASEYPFETQLYYSCFDDYVLEGDSFLVCAEYGAWSAEPPMCFPKCGVSFADVIPTGPTLIEMNGTNEWPWTVTLAAKSNVDIACTGVLIDQNTVLTAASRVSTFKTFYIFFGRLQRNVSTDEIDVNVRVSTEIILHPKFNASIRFENDIALVKFAPKVRYTEKIIPICLPTNETTEKNIKPGNIGYVAGLGYLVYRTVSKKLVFGQVPVLSTEDCEQFSRYFNFNLTGDYFCVGSPTETYSATCVDTGSSLAFYDSVNDIYTLEGIVTNFLCRMIIIQRIPMWIPKGSYLGMVKVQSFLPWIIENISN